MKNYICYFDGSCEPFNPGGTIGIGVHIQQGENVFEYSNSLPPDKKNSNNVAEYMSAFKLLDLLRKKENVKIQIFGDSKMVVEQLTGRRKIKKGLYVPYALKTKELYDLIVKKNEVSIHWIPREENMLADELSKQG